MKHKKGFINSVDMVNLPGGEGGGGRLLGSIFAGYVPLASQKSYPFMAYFMSDYRPHLSHFWVNVILATF